MIKTRYSSIDSTPDPTRVGDRWVFPNGHSVPVVSGGSGDTEGGDGDGAADGDGAGSGDGADGGTGGDGGSGDDGTTVTVDRQQLADLISKVTTLNERSTNRPKSTRDQLQEQMEEALALVADGTVVRKGGRDVADTAESIAVETRNELRRRDIVDAATAAGFIDPTDAATELVGIDGDPAELVAALAVKKAHWVRKTTERDPIGSDGKAITDPGHLAYAAQIAAANEA